MKSNSKNESLLLQYQKLHSELELIYGSAFEKLGELDLKESELAKRVQILLNSRNSAISPIEQEINSLSKKQEEGS